MYACLNISIGKVVLGDCRLGIGSLPTLRGGLIFCLTDESSDIVNLPVCVDVVGQ